MVDINFLVGTVLSFLWKQVKDKKVHFLVLYLLSLSLILLIEYFAHKKLGITSFYSFAIGQVLSLFFICAFFFHSIAQDKLLEKITETINEQQSRKALLCVEECTNKHPNPWLFSDEMLADYEEKQSNLKHVFVFSNFLEEEDKPCMKNAVQKNIKSQVAYHYMVPNNYYHAAQNNVQNKGLDKSNIHMVSQNVMYYINSVVVYADSDGERNIFIKISGTHFWNKIFEENQKTLILNSLRNDITKDNIKSLI